MNDFSTRKINLINNLITFINDNSVEFFNLKLFFIFVVLNKFKKKISLC